MVVIRLRGGGGGEITASCLSTVCVLVGEGGVASHIVIIPAYCVLLVLKFKSLLNIYCICRELATIFLRDNDNKLGTSDKFLASRHYCVVAKIVVSAQLCF